MRPDSFEIFEAFGADRHDGRVKVVAQKKVSKITSSRSFLN